jgi:hypothetical protein
MVGISFAIAVYGVVSMKQLPIGFRELMAVDG